MNLLPPEAEQLFRLMHALQLFVNEQLQLVPEFSTLDQFVDGRKSLELAEAAITNAGDLSSITTRGRDVAKTLHRIEKVLARAQ